MREMKVLALRSRLFGGGFKPPHAALVEDRRGERCGKGARDVSGGDQEDDRRVRCRYSMRWHQNRDSVSVPGMSLAGVRSSGQVVSGIHDGVSLICCSRTEQGKVCRGIAARGWRVARGSVSSGSNREGSSTVAGHAGGPARSSDEAAVMVVERRGRVVRGLSFWSTDVLGRNRGGEAEIGGR